MKVSDNRTTVWQPLSTDGGENVFIEVALEEGREKVGLFEAIPIEQITTLVGDIAQSIGKGIERAAPTKASIELGVEFGLQEGRLVGLIARGSGKANLKITFEWDRAAKHD